MKKMLLLLMRLMKGCISCKLPAYENNCYNMMLKKNKLSNFRFTNISEDFLEFPSSQTTGLSQRFFAYVNNQRRMTSFYFPSKNQQDITRLYYGA